MITAAGCRARRERLLDHLKPAEPLLLGDPLHLRYFAGFTPDSVSNGADYAGLLHVRPDGSAKLYYDHRVAKTSIEAAHTDEKEAVTWYDGISPGRGPRRMILRVVAEKLGGVIHDTLTAAGADKLFDVVGELRRGKDADEIAVISACCRAGEAGMAWARGRVETGMTELDVYAGVASECTRAAGFPVVTYGDFAVSPGSARRGGPPTSRVLAAGDTLILDFSVVIQGYRSDFTNTLVVGIEPTPGQQRLFDLSFAAMRAGEAALRPGATGKGVYQAVRGVFAAAGVADSFPHHAGHGLGMAHPEAPFLVRESHEVLVAGDVVTLEPGLYVDGVGGVRIEHNYAITATGFTTLSRHHLGLK